MITLEARAALEAVLGPFADIAELINLVKAALKAT